MAITQAEIDDLEKNINARLAAHNAQFKMTVHFSLDRLNDARNNPPLTLAELDSVFTKVIDNHILAILVLNDGDTFNIRCLTSHINMPCAVKKSTSANSTVTHKNIVITIMRKKTFFAKDPVEFQV